MIDDFLNRLDKVRRAGKDYYAICPVGSHSGKNRTLSLTVKNDVVMGKCFSCGATTREVADALGLGVSHINPHWSPNKDRPVLPKYSKDRRIMDVYIIEMVEAINWDDVALKDKQSYRMAKKRLNQWNDYVKAMYENK